MKKPFLFIAMTILCSAACGHTPPESIASFPRALGERFVSDAANAVEVDISRFAVGIQPAGDTSYFINSTPFCARPFVFGEELRAIRAGEGIYDTRVVYNVGVVQVPIVLELYNDCQIDAANPKRYLYIGHVGFAAKIFDVGPYRPFVWVLDRSEIVRPDSTPLSLYWDDRAYPPPVTRARVVKVKLPNFWVNGSVFYQFYNPSNYTQKLVFGGRMITLTPRGGRWTEWRFAKDSELHIPVQLLTGDEESGYTLFGITEYVLPPAPPEGVASIQYIGRWEIFRR